MKFGFLPSKRTRRELLIALAAGSATASALAATSSPPASPAMKPAKLGAKAPKGAVVLFNGKDTKQWVKAGGKEPISWKLDGDAMVVSGGNIETVPRFTDFQLHVEFNVPDMPNASGQGKGNSGVYLQGLYEIQVLDSYKNETYANGACGAIYGQYAPRVNASKPPGTWQSYDIWYTAPRYKEGKLAQKPRATVFHNGVLIHDRAEIEGATTASGNYDSTQAGPIMLQDHGNPVKYRNIWIKPITAGK